MTIAVGDRLPETTLTMMGAEGPEPVALHDLAKGRKVVIFAVPGAYTPTCHSAHVPSFVRVREGLAGKGVDEVICISVNDPFVMGAWGDITGARKAGIRLLADAECTFTDAIGMRFDAPSAGLIARSKRYALAAEDGVVTHLHAETDPGACEISGGEAMLEAL